jgi:uncharacterized protein YabE (DUF348 family)
VDKIIKMVPAKVQYILSKAWIAAAVLLAFAALWSVQHVSAADTASGDQRLVTIHDRGVEQTIITRAETVAGALNQAGVTLDDADLVEPAASERLVANNYSINVYRARPVVVSDGQKRIRVVTAAQSPRQIAAAAGTTMYEEDRAKIERVDDVLADGGAGLKLSIDRATPFTFVLYGKHLEARSQATTVGDMLKEKDVELGPQDGVSVPVSTPLVAGMTVEVWRNGIQTVTQEEDIAMPVEQIKDQDREVGYKEVRTPGKPGKKQVTYEINMQNGKEVSRKVIQEVQTLAPVKQVEVVGAKVKSFGGSCGEWMAAAGITDIANATYLINKESGCNPYSVNRSSGACGVGQALPCSKTGCEMGDGACQTRWMNSYVLGRYGSWQAAADHHRRYGWY